MGEAIADQLIQKLGLQNEPKISSKTYELLRLLDLKSSTVGSCVGDYAKTVICIDIAATNLGLSFDLIDAVKNSGLRKTAYQTYKRTFEKLLDINKDIGINHICTQLGINEISKKATTLLDLFKKNNGNNDIDTSHAQYASMAIYQACKLKKQKISKAKILSFSHLRPSQWSRLEKQWDIFINNANLNSNTHMKDTENCDTNDNSNENLKKNERKNQKSNEIEDYEVWKHRKIKEALQKYAKTKKIDIPGLDSGKLPTDQQILKLISPDKNLSNESDDSIEAT